MTKLVPTTVIGSYPQPDWLIDRERLGARLPPRGRAAGLWRVGPAQLAQAQDDATLLAIRDQERAGIDIVSDGEMRRESFSNRFLLGLEGVDLDDPAMVALPGGGFNPVPRVVGPIVRTRAVEVEDVRFLRANTERMIKITVPGPFTLAQQVQNEAYDDDASLALAFAAALHDEIEDLFAAGADIVQVDEPWLQARAAQAGEYAIATLDHALSGVEGTTVLHTCFGYAHVQANKPTTGYPFLTELANCAADQIAIEAAQPKLDLSVLAGLAEKTVIVGVLDLADPLAETPERVVERIERALAHVSPERLVLGPDCGMKYLSRELAFAKLTALVAGAEIVRSRLS